MQNTLRNFDLKIMLPGANNSDINFINPSLNISGDYIFIDRINDGVSGVDMPVEITFDDQYKIVRLPGQGVRRSYQRVSFKLVSESSPGASNNTPTFGLRVVAGVGELYDERHKITSPRVMECSQLIVPAGDWVSINGDIVGSINSWFGPDFRVHEVRLCVPSSEANGIFYTSEILDAEALTNGAWLEKGMVEWLTYSGTLMAYNTGASDVTLTLAKIIERKFP